MKATLDKNKDQAPPAGICPVCGSGLMYPLENSQATADTWQLLLVCPECFAWRRLCVGRCDLAEIMVRAQTGRADICRELAELEHRHMREECEKFIAALWRCDILPLDF